MEAHERGIEAALKAWLRGSGWDLSMKDAIKAYLEESGQVLVPREPAREMWAAMGNAFYGYRNRHHDKVSEDFWKAAIAAAPNPFHTPNTVKQEEE